MNESKVCPHYGSTVCPLGKRCVTSRESEAAEMLLSGIMPFSHADLYEIQTNGK